MVPGGDGVFVLAKKVSTFSHSTRNRSRPSRRTFRPVKNCSDPAKVETNGSRDVMQYVASDDVQHAIEAITSDGCVVLENAVSESEAADLAELVLSSPTRAPGVSGYEFVVCLLNHDQRFLKLAMHPTVLELARHLLGGRTEPAGRESPRR